jgi:succinate dehydrogenase / fumarate reductase flavoprotein subunit
MPALDSAALEACARDNLAPFEGEGDENPYALLQELQRIMETYAGIVRTGAELERGLAELDKLRPRLSRMRVEGTRQFNPGWHSALDLRNLFLVSEAIALAALQRTESRGAHSRIDFPRTDPAQEGFNIAVFAHDGRMDWRKEPREPIPNEMMRLIEVQPGELTAEEMAPVAERRRGF